MPFGRKDKSKDKSTSERKNRSDVAGLFMGGAQDFNDEDLEAELLALEGKPPKGTTTKIATSNSSSKQLIYLMKIMVFPYCLSEWYACIAFSLLLP